MGNRITLHLVKLNNLLLHTFAYAGDPKEYENNRNTWVAMTLHNCMRAAVQWAMDNSLYDEAFIYYSNEDQQKVIFSCIAHQSGISKEKLSDPLN